jgi:ABC-2 type transport system ATP-binding protein
LDWVAAQPAARTDAEGDPRVGMVGFSYGGGIQLTVAGIDCRVDALVPGLAWHSLESSLFKAEIVKAGWSGVLVGAAATGEVDPHVTSAYESGTEDGTLSDEDLAWFLERGPAELVDEIGVPALLVQGTTDTLFTLDEAVTNYRNLRERDVPVSMVWFCGGHGTCLTDAGNVETVSEASFAWLDRYVKGDETVDTGPRFRFVDQDGTAWSADDYPLATATTIEASGGGSLDLVADGGSGPYAGPSASSDLLSGLVAPITPGPAENAVEVAIEPSEDGLVVGAPRLTLTYSGTTPEGSEPTRVFAQLVDEERGVVVGNQVTPIEVVLDGSEHTVEADLEVIAQRIEPGQTLTLQLVATTVSYAHPRLGGEITFSDIVVELPVVDGAKRG